MTAPRKVTPAMIDRVKRLREWGLSIRRIAARVELAPRLVQSIINQHIKKS
jgi:hypothetical protein